MDDSTGGEVWTRQPGETSRAFEAFAVYRDMGPSRSLAKVAKRLNKHISYIEEWSVKYRWVPRAKAFDTHLDDVQRERFEEERRNMADRHARIAMLMISKLSERLVELDPAKLSPGQIERWFQTATTVERLSRGEATERVDHLSPLPVQTFNYNDAIAPVLDDAALSESIDKEMQEEG